MPFYEYQCQKCGHHHEALQKINDAPLKKCPECGRSTLKRLMSAPVFRLKGGGWYETDFKSDAEGKRNIHGEADDKAAVKADAKDTTKAEPKAAESKPAEAAPKAAETKPVAKPKSVRKPVGRKPATRKR